MQLNIDPNRPYHCIIGVAVKTMYSSDPGKMYLKYGPIRFTNGDVEKVRDAKVLSEDKLFRTTRAEAININDCGDLVFSLSALMYSARVNECTIHHFSSAFEVDEEDLKTLVNTANFSESSKKLIQDSKM